MPDTVVYELQFVGDKVNAFGDNRVTEFHQAERLFMTTIFKCTAYTFGNRLKRQ